jgi:F0F1-type ATP synthase assembly protein I
MKTSYDFLSASSFGLMLFLSVIVGMGMGYSLDKLFKTAPVLTILFTILGMISGIVSIFKELKNFKDDPHS